MRQKAKGELIQFRIVQPSEADQLVRVLASTYPDASVRRFKRSVSADCHQMRVVCIVVRRKVVAGV